ncbi:YihY/virulence factor BrkB family protein [Ectothiorhodospira lacustris]|uniref:YihY/virulence factor BrkB family protein n=1 Tax=Ectothiorhodospira lacustris TaxID=2899127 RepID=UPI001EE82320|nr:YihY/virulence factor BrkB family protein [Ectothiorhodospira lacustris]MCG5502047.1 YihY/virulence factor BrkB family protein [Ectothiorhodospira lacustris]MCG5511473.1 YihY/virulence factor BrkB family protein [Ectothiorhodospira lacustris]MCG5523264.1 YihY/virulence factor BrkB family protein [Ectothiorhodospira lacustris]
MPFGIYEKLPAPVRHWLSILAAASRILLASQAFIYAAALAFFTVFSIAPILLVIVTLVGLVIGQSAVRGELFGQLEGTLGPEAAGMVQEAVINSQIDQSGIWPALIGIIATVVGATTVFAQLQLSLNQIWEVAPRPSRSGVWIFVKSRVLSLTIILAIGFTLLVSLILSVALRGVMAFADEWLPVPGWAMVGMEIFLSLLVVTFLFAAIFKILPDVVLSWRDVLLGALITAVLFTVGRSLISVYLAYTATASTYGAAGSLALLLLWVNYSSMILLFGAAFTRAHFEARGKPVLPKSTAVCVRRELIEEVQKI